MKSLSYFCTTVHTDKSKVKILQNFVAFSEYMNLNLSLFEYCLNLIFSHWYFLLGKYLLFENGFDLWILNSVGISQISAAPPFTKDNICRSALNILSFDMIIKINQLLFPKLYFMVISYPGPPRQARQPRFDPCLLFLVSMRSNIRNNQSQKFLVEYWTLPGSNLPWRPFLGSLNSK